MVKVYTRTGDDGTTYCFKSGRIPKDDRLIEAIGSVDELNSMLGLLVAQLNAEPGAITPEEIAEIQSIQNRLFDVGGALATWSVEKQFAELLSRIDEVPLEQWIDRMEEQLPEIRQFILPGGAIVASQAHLCRAFCRRAERHVVAVYHGLAEDSERVANGLLKVMKYLNRLSDYLFVVARYLNQQAGGREIFWTQES